MGLKVGVVSDTHMPRQARDLPAALRKGLRGVDAIVHCGDMVDAMAIPIFEAIAPFEAVAGNNDPPDLQKRFGARKVLEIGGLRIGVVHGHAGPGKTTPDRAARSFPDEHLDAILFGHSHVPFCERRNGVLLFNPGSPTERRRASYDKRYVERFWRVLLQADRLCKVFRSRFIGKSSPVHFFWGAFDLAVTRFSGRTAPPHPGGFPNMPDSAMREAYSHEVQSVGFWPGGSAMEAAFYSYAYPLPPGFAQAAVKPREAAWNDQLREFILPYEAVRTSPDPDRAVLDFFNSTYEAAAETGAWDRVALERFEPNGDSAYAARSVRGPT